MSCDVTIVVNLHREGRLAWRSIRSAFAACEDAESNHIGTELLLALDTPDESTEEIAERALQTFHGCGKIISHLGDLGLMRNLAVEEADGRYITFLDGDDLTTPSWITNAYDLASELLDNNVLLSVVHREWMLKFGDGLVPSIVKQPRSMDINQEWLLTENLWCSSVLAARQVFEKVPYKACPPGFNFEDWCWHCDVIDYGSIPIITVPGEVIFVRNKAPSESLGQRGYHGKARGMKNKLFDKPVSMAIATTASPLDNGTPIPQSVIDAWQEIHATEPSTWPQDLRVLTPQCRDLDRAWYMLWNAWNRATPDVVFAATRMAMGGLEQAMIWHIQQQVNSGANVTLVLSDSTRGNPWLSRLPRRGDQCAVNVIDLRKLLANVEPPIIQALVSRMLVQYPPRVLSIHNCPLMWNILTENPYATCSSTNVFVTAYCGDVVRTKQSVHVSGAGFDSLNNVYDHIAGAFFDGNAFPDELKDIYGYDGRKAFVLDHPVENKTIRAREITDGGFNGYRLKVLWAARCDAQKRPELAMQIMAECAKQNVPVDFECWGLGPNEELPKMFDLLTNAEACGPFDGFDSLPLERYDAYLYTAEWDGASILVRSACGAGLAIITAGNGSVGEIDIYTVEDAVQNYVDRIKDLCDINTLKQDQKRCHYAILHLTRERFNEQLEAVPGYIAK